MAIKITPQEYKTKFGVSVTQMPKVQPKQGVLANFSLGDGFKKVVTDPIKQAFSGGVDQVKQGIQDSKTSNPIKGLESSLKIGAGVANAAFSPLAPVFKPVEAGINKVADKISNSPKVQQFADSKAGQVTSRVTEDVANLDTIAGAVGGSKKLVGEAGPLAHSVGNSIAEKTGNLAAHAKNVTGDVVPSMDRVVNHQVTSALDLTAGDIKNIHQSTGNEVGRFMADRNLIGANKDITVQNVTKHFGDKYAEVRSEIGKVTDTYKPSQLPRYTEALKAIQQKIEKVPGLQKEAVEVSRLLGKKDGIQLADMQRVKELLDDHFNLYKVTGDVGEGVAKEGLVNIRKDIQTFIESEVKDKTGADIHQLNNDVSTSKSILDAIDERSTRGLTRANLRLGDLGIFGVGTAMGGGNPLFGLAAVFGKKLLEAPSVQLRIAKFLDGLSDARKAAIVTDLESGKIPTEFDKFIKKGKGIGPGAMARGELARNAGIKGTLPADSLITHEGAPDIARVEMYKNNLQANQPVDRIKVIREAGGYAVEDGKHRLAAYKELGHERVPVEIVKKRVKVNNYQTPRFTKGKNGQFTGSH